MSRETHKLAAQTRAAFGDNASRRLRRAGIIPAVVYSKGVEPRSVQVSADEWKVVSAHGSQIITLVEEGRETPVLIREVQFNHLGLYSWRFALPVNGFYVPSTAALARSASGEPVVLDSIVELEKRGESNPAIPANLERLESFFGKNAMMMRNFIFPCDVSDAQRDAAAKELYIKYGIFADKETASAYAVVKENCSEVYDEDGAFILTAYNHPSLSSDYCRHVIGEAPEMPEEIKAGFEPFELKRPVISTAAELKTIAQNMWK